MALSILVAKILALIYLAAGVAALSGKMSFVKIVDDFEKSTALTFMTGFMAIVIGMLLVEYHNLWAWEWPVLITIVGWASIIKGLMFIAFPNMISFFKPWYKKNQTWGTLMVVVGLIFGYFGFIA